MTTEQAYKEIAPRLRGLREAVDLSLEELAAKTGIAPEQAAAYESGARDIPVSYLVNVAHICGVDLTVLLSGGEAHLHSYCLVRKDKGLSVVEEAVTGVPDPDRGQVVKATIVLAPGFDPSPELTKDIQSHVKKVTAPYKYPRLVDYVAELPKTISGKIKRAEIRARDMR